MASPGAYQQLASVSQLDQPCCQMESTGYQPTASLPASVASYQRPPPMESYPQSHHQTMTPPMERVVNNRCPTAPAIDYMHPGYHLADTSMPQMMGWSSLYMHQQQHGGVKPMEFVEGHLIPQNVGCRSTPLGCRSDADRQRRYAAKDCNKTVASRSLMRSQNAVPNVAVQPGTNMITGYDVYGPSVAGCSGNLGGGGEVSPALDYHSLHRRAALGYHGGYVSDRPHVGVPADVYRYRQPAAGGYAAAGMQSGRVRGQSVCPSTMSYGYMGRSLVGHDTYDMNLTRH